MFDVITVSIVRNVVLNDVDLLPLLMSFNGVVCPDFFAVDDEPWWGAAVEERMTSW